MDIFSTHGMLVSSLILLVCYIFIIFDRIPKATIAVFGGALTLFLGIIPPEKAFEYIDFRVIFLLVSMMIIVHIAGRSGMFNYIAIELLKKTKGQPLVILAILSIFTAIVSAFLDNVTTVILVMPITFVIARELEIEPIPFLITEILTSNIGGTATLIGDPPNIIIGSAASFGFADFVRELIIPIFSILLVSILLLMFLFRKELITHPEKMTNIESLDNSETITDKSLMMRASVVLFLVIAGFILHDIIRIESYVIALLGASWVLFFEKPKDILKDVEWTTLAFFIGLFLIIGGLVETGAIKFLANKMLEFTQGDTKIASVLILWASGIISGIVDNIPYTVTMVPLIQELSTKMDVYPLWWCLSLGACLGGNATIIGAAANVIVSETSEAAGHPISFVRFMKYGLLITFISLVLSTIYIYFRFLA